MSKQYTIPNALSQPGAGAIEDEMVDFAGNFGRIFRALCQSVRFGGEGDRSR